jgi:predicted Fe-Mo cluster-binding NifX family protein
VAIASTNGQDINEHFGHAAEFHIFDFLDNGSPVHVEARENPPWCGDAELQANASEPFEKTVAVLSDCQVVLASRFGPCAAQALSSHSIDFFEVDGPAGPAFERLSKYFKVSV